MLESCTKHLRFWHCQLASWYPGTFLTTRRLPSSAVLYKESQQLEKDGRICSKRARETDDDGWLAEMARSGGAKRRLLGGANDDGGDGAREQQKRSQAEPGRRKLKGPVCCMCVCLDVCEQMSGMSPEGCWCCCASNQDHAPPGEGVCSNRKSGRSVERLLVRVGSG